MAKSVKIEGVEYKSRTEAAKALVAAGKTIGEAAEMTGMTYQTVYANTKGAEKAAGRRNKYRVLALGRSGKKTAGEIAKKTGLSVSAVVALLKKNGVVVVSKEKKSEKKTTTTAPKAKAKKTSAKKENAVTPEVPATPEGIPVDAAAEAAAKADMATE